MTTPTVGITPPCRATARRDDNGMGVMHKHGTPPVRQPEELRTRMHADLDRARFAVFERLARVREALPEVTVLRAKAHKDETQFL